MNETVGMTHICKLCDKEINNNAKFHKGYSICPECYDDLTERIIAENNLMTEEQWQESGADESASRLDLD